MHKTVKDMFQEININLEGGLAKHVNPRARPDIPLNIVKQGQWMQPEPREGGIVPPPTYHAIENHMWYPVEFINDKWYWLEWDNSTKFRGYWVRASKEIPPGTSNLGWDRRQEETPTPKPLVGSSFTETRERAESASTQAKEELPQEPEDDDNFIDTNPKQTEESAENFEGLPVLAEVAEELEYSGERAHYMPTTLPSAAKLRPVFINPTPRPIKARAITETAATTHDATQLISNALKLDGALKGTLPDTFDGDRTKTHTFMNAFDLFWMTNEESAVMKNPYRRCTLFLGLLKGTKVEDWVNDQAVQLREKVKRKSDPIVKTEESLWEDLKDAFEDNYAYTGRIEQARSDLGRLEMSGDQIDEYIAKFENLLKRAEIPRGEVGAIEKFRNGLKKGLRVAILKRDDWPETLDEWEEKARREVRRYKIFKEVVEGTSNPFGSSDWQHKAKKLFGRKKKDEDAMQVDAAQMDAQKGKRRINIEEQQRLKQEGRCFKCHKQGHMKTNCPAKNEAPPKYTPKPSKTGGRSALAEEPSATEEDTKDLARKVQALDNEGRDALLQAMLEDSDF
jgi:Retrotransposon gag protein